MASGNRFGVLHGLRRTTLDAFVRLYPYLAIVSIASMTALMLAIGSYDLAIDGLETIGVPVVFGSALLIASRRSGRLPVTGSVAPPTFDGSLVARLLRRRQITVSAFLLLFALSVLLLGSSPRRPWSYFVVVSLVYALMVLQILLDAYDPRVLLAEVQLLMLNLIYGVTLKYEYYYGWTDVFRHVERAMVTHLTGETIPQSLSLLYAKFPLYHIFVSEATYVLDLNLKTSLFVVTAIPYVVTAVLLYYLLDGNFRDDRVPALATVLYSANTIVLFYGNYMITRTMAFVGFMFLLYLIYKRSRRKDLSYNVLIVLMTVFTTLVHQVSMPMIIVLLMGLYVCERVVGYSGLIDLETILLVGFGFTTYWLFNAWEFLSTILLVYLSPDLYSDVGGGGSSGGGTESVEFAYWLRYTLNNYVIIFYAVVGIGVGLYEEYSKYVQTLLLFALLTIGLFVPSPLRIIEQAMSVLRFDRFMLLVSPFVAIAMATGVVWVLHQMDYGRTVNALGVGVALVLIVTYAFTSISAPLVASDSNDLPWSESRKHLNEQEVEGFGFVLENVEPGSPIRSTAHTTKFFNRQAFAGYDRQFQPTYAADSIDSIGEISEYEGYTVFRKARFQESGLRLTFDGPTILPRPETERQLNREFGEKAKIFSNGDVEIYYTNETAG